jgi:hypothetical protein
MTGAAAVAAWTGPALVAAVIARVTLGGVEAPLFVLAVMVAPVLALLAGPGPPGAPCALEVAVELVTAVCVLGAGFRVMLDFGRVLGVESGVALGSSIALVLVTTVWPGRGEGAAAALALGGGALVLAVIVVGIAAASPPWTAWSRIASRAAFEIGSRSPWTREGALASEPMTVTFSEPHRVSAVTAGVYRVTERDRGTDTVREWRPATGDSLTLRPGDSLSIPAGARLRFESGKRVPLAPGSGVAWADRLGASRAHLLAGWVGLVVTLVGGALAVVRPLAPLSSFAAIAAPAALLGVVWAATCWGIYAVDAAPELAFGASSVVPLAHLASVIADDPWRSRLLGAVVMALVALLLATAVALRARFAALAGRGRPPVAPTRRVVLGVALWIVMVTTAAAAGLAVVDGWALLGWGAGLAAAMLPGPLVATRNAVGLGSARTKGALAGALLFVAVAAATRWLAPPAAAVVQYPALIAAPGAWLVTVFARREMMASGRRR